MTPKKKDFKAPKHYTILPGYQAKVKKNKKYSLHTYLHSERLDSLVYKIRQDLK